MSLNADDVKKIAHLARLDIDENAGEDYTQQLSNILGFIEQMNSVDTSNVKPLSHPVDTSQRLRDDQISEENCRDKFQQIAPNTEAGLYLVPKVIEEA